MWISTKKKLPDMGAVVLIKGSKIQNLYSWEFPILLARRTENRHFKIGWSWNPVNIVAKSSHNVADLDVEFWSSLP